MHKVIIALVSFVLLVGSYSCKQADSHTAIAPTEIPFTKEGELSLYKNDGTFIRKIDIEIADDDYQRETGLMHRSSLKQSQGMLFIFDQEVQRAFYMKNTLIALDIIYLNEDGVIVSFAENAKPEDPTSLPSTVPAQYVLEINGGLSEEWVLEIGDRIEWERY
jgi:uncharacterized membrane protein (UPF0127 family)